MIAELPSKTDWKYRIPKTLRVKIFHALAKFISIHQNGAIELIEHTSTFVNLREDTCRLVQHRWRLHWPHAGSGVPSLMGLKKNNLKLSPDFGSSNVLQDFNFTKHIKRPICISFFSNYSSPS
jgi:hypothetical protein